MHSIAQSPTLCKLPLTRRSKLRPRRPSCSKFSVLWLNRVQARISVNGGPMPPTKPLLTNPRVFLDISIGGEAVGRMTFEVRCSWRIRMCVMHVHANWMPQINDKNLQHGKQLIKNSETQIRLKIQYFFRSLRMNCQSHRKILGRYAQVTNWCSFVG